MTGEQMAAKLREPRYLLSNQDYREAANLIERQAAEIARKDAALRDVVNPLGHLRRYAESQGHRLSGEAFQIANNLGFVQDIARKALEDTNG
ncbi:hypothetical protein [Sphingomonas ursincola]|uniref:hypothetical protein n=1 Tax=Sphingomonas ursincola TaxID=56361 RepID=UPI002355C732|nr:hypothetical protein [Sphingomonas ursincola]MBY0618436.1 hypothetical protein [Sphingomonas ursincola]